MASSTPKKGRLKLQAPVLKVEKDPAFYIVPPLLVAAVFAFCAYVPRNAVNFKRPSGVRIVAAEKKARVEMPDPNASLPDYEMPSGCRNLLEGVTAVNVSAAEAGAPALNAVDGSSANDANVAMARPSGGPAWWQAELPSARVGQAVVIYGGGSQSPAGKLEGGFRVEVEYAGGGKDSREFCREGFALEGYETMKLGGTQGVKRIRVTSLKSDTPIVLREVQLIGPAN